MLSEIQILIIFGLSIAGTVTNAVIGYLESNEPFNPRKFVPSVLRAVIAGIGFAVGYGIVDVVITSPGELLIIYASVFLGAAGIDSMWHRISKLQGPRQTPET